MTKVRLGDVAKEHKEACKGNKAGYPIVGLEHLNSGEISLTKWDEDKENTFIKIFRKGNMLFGRRRAYLKKAAVAPFDGICSGDITVIEAIPEKLLPELLPFVIQNDQLFDYAVEKSAGSLSPRVKWEHLKNYEFELPGLEKQRELAEVLWAMNDTLEAYKELLVKTDELVKARFIELFEKRYPTIRLGDEFKTISGGTPASKKSEYYVGGTIPWLTSGEVNLGIIEKTENYITDAGMDSSSAKWVPKNSIVIAMYGATAGKVGLLKLRTTTNQAVCSILPHKDYNPYYLYYAIKHQEQWMISKVAGAAQPNISQTIIKDMQVIKPPLYLQEEFAAFVRQINISKSELEKSITELEATYKKIISENLN